MSDLPIWLCGTCDRFARRGEHETVMACPNGHYMFAATFKMSPFEGVDPLRELLLDGLVTNES